MYLLFLDIDGVLHPVLAPDGALLSKRPLLEAWLRRRPDVDIVVPSSWRLSHSLEQLQAYFAPEVRAHRSRDFAPHAQQAAVSYEVARH